MISFFLETMLRMFLFQRNRPTKTRAITLICTVQMQFREWYVEPMKCPPPCTSPNNITVSRALLFSGSLCCQIFHTKYFVLQWRLISVKKNFSLFLLRGWAFKQSVSQDIKWKSGGRIISWWHTIAYFLVFTVLVDWKFRNACIAD